MQVIWDTGADDASWTVLLFLYSYQAFLPPRGRIYSVPGVLLQDYYTSRAEK